MKGNNGQAARRKLQQRLGVVLGSFGSLFFLLHLFRHRSSASTQLSHGLDQFRQATGRLRSRSQSNNLPGHSIRWLKENDPIEDDAWQDILKARVHLVDLVVDGNEVAMNVDPENPTQYGGVYGVFCRIDWSTHKEDPSSVPMFRDVVAKSSDCSGNRFKVDLRLAVDRVKEFDRKHQDAHVLDLAAVVFHESRCGSTLVANLLATMNPSQHRVYSESAPPITALKGVCGESYERCSTTTAARVLQDTIHLMQRSDDPAEKRVFFKIQSAGTRNLPVFQEAFPETPWLFVYREPVQVMISHLPVGIKNIRLSNCVRQQSRGPPQRVREILERRHPGKHVSSISPIEYCAAHLASITETAVTALEASDWGIPVNYRDLPQVLWEDILPNRLGLTVGPTEMQRMQACAGQYSKGRENNVKQGSFHEDSDRKEAMASQEVRTAAQAILSESYQALEEASEMVLTGKQNDGDDDGDDKDEENNEDDGNL